MSVYSGFATRQLEQLYNKQIVNLIKVLQKRVLKFYRNEYTDELSFRSVFTSVYQKILQFEENKYFEPYYSQHVLDLCSYLKINENCSQEESFNNTKDIKKKTSINGCNCMCHQKFQPENSTFITGYNMSQNRFHQKSHNVSQEDLKKSEREKSQLSKTNRQSYMDSSRNSTRRGHIQNKTKIINRKNESVNEGVLRLTNISFENQNKQFRQPSQLIQFQSQRNHSASRTPKTAIPSKRSPYYSVIYPFQGQTYNKVSVERRNSTNKNPAYTGNLKNTTNSGKTPYMPEKLIQNQKPSCSISTPKRSDQGARSLAPTIPMIMEVSVQNEVEPIKKNNNHLNNAQIQKETIEQKNQSENVLIITNYLNQCKQDKNISSNRQIDLVIKIQEEEMNNIPNPNESNEQTIEKQK